MSILMPVTACDQAPALGGTTTLIVGPTSGIGEALAYQLAATGTRLLLAGRDAGKLDALAAKLRDQHDATVDTVVVDLASLASIANAAESIRQKASVIQLMIANAAVLYTGKQRQFTRDGFELCIGVNHLGNAALILALKEQLQAAPARLVIVASEAHRRAGGLPLEDLQFEHNFSSILAYNRSKLCNILFARELARHWASTGITVYSAHPGAVKTPMMRTSAQVLRARILIAILSPLLLEPDEAARGILRVAAEPKLKEPSGSYFELGRFNQGGALSLDRELAAGLWTRTLELIGYRQ